MVRKTFHPVISRRLFLKELKALLNSVGVSPSRYTITANNLQKENKNEPSTEAQSNIGRIIIYIKENLGEPLSIDELAKEAQLSKYQLIRGFREKRGTTPWKYLISKRIDRAKKLLENGTPPGQAAAETGFYDQSHLNRTFKEETGQTPKEYQQENFRNKN